MAEKGLRFVVTADGIVDNDVWCDGVRLDSVLLNLVSNAYKFTPEGGEVRLQASQEGYDEHGRGLYRFIVSDTGIGMSEAFVRKIFEPFEREHSTVVAHTQGTGLGTAITKSLVDMMGGTIEVRSTLGAGSVFEVVLPFELMDEERLARERMERSADAPGQADIEGVRVLLVDDSEINLELTMLLLEERGAQVSCATNGQEALDAIEERADEFDVVLMDLRMPVMDGLEAARAIRALDDPTGAAIPLIAASASSDEQDVATAMDAGFDDYVTKPIDIDRVAQAMLRHLR
jgi:CheY-like chemotaxis protein/anti-sigma regulatory factor (Ser/Thr protein kinase)